jgi:hypothetical protein
LFGILHGGPARLAEVMAMLPEPRRAALERIAAELSRLPADELRARWASLRSAEREQMRQAASLHVGLRLDEFPPRVQEWLMVSHGREDHQG